MTGEDRRGYHIREGKGAKCRQRAVETLSCCSAEAQREKVELNCWKDPVFQIQAALPHHITWLSVGTALDAWISEALAEVKKHFGK